MGKDRRTRMQNAGQAASTSESSSSPLLGQDPQVPLPADWDRLKRDIHALYMVKNLPLKEVRARMERDYSFKATERMFKTRLAQWGYVKKMRDVDWQAVAVLSKELQKSGRKASAFKVHRRKIKLADLKKYLKDQKMSEDDLLAEAAANDINGQNIPNHIRCFNALATAEPGSPAPNSSQDPSVIDHST